LVVLGEIAAEIAHELHNVLQVIATNAYVARQDLGKGAGHTSLPFVVKIENAAHLGHAITDDLLALARGEPLQSEPVLVADLLAAARADFAQGSATWSDRVTPPDLRVRVRTGLMTRLFRTLYDNAIRASTPRVPTITTHAWVEGGRLLVDVADDGPGVPASIRERVLEPLVSAREGGTGLGLALAKRIALAHGGTLTLLDTSLGATFRVELPGQP
jgi:signal transduction histidine kinase